MAVNARRLFLKLLPELGINAVCDVGSLNGDEALAFRTALPRAPVLAFEASPENVRRMQANRALHESGVEIVPRAVTNFDGEADFFVLDADYAAVDGRQGMSSLHKRPDVGSIRSRPVRVQTTRLDTFFAARRHADLRLALWIDVEGGAYEVIEGLGALAREVYMLHAEVETNACIAPGQRLYAEVLGLLQSLGFNELAIDGDRGAHQFNAVFVRQDMPAETRRRVERQRAIARARLAVTGGVRRAFGTVKRVAGLGQATNDVTSVRPPALPRRGADPAFVWWRALVRKVDALRGGSTVRTLRGLDSWPLRLRYLLFVVECKLGRPYRGRLAPTSTAARVRRDGYEFEPRPGTSDRDVLFDYHEVQTRAFLRRHLAQQPRSGVLLDVGAHCGCYSLTLESFFDHVLAVEPLPENFDALERNVLLNRLDGKIRRFPVAAGAAAGTGTFFVQKDDTSSLIPTTAPSRTLEVAIRPLDDLLEEEGLAPWEVRLLKADVEGAEMDVLTGARRILEEGSPLVVLEANTGAAKAELTSHLERLGYVLVRVADGRNLCFARYQPGDMPRPVAFVLGLAARARTAWQRS